MENMRDRMPEMSKNSQGVMIKDMLIIKWDIIGQVVSRGKIL